MNWKEFLHIWLSNSFSLNIEIGMSFFVIIIIGIIFFLFFKSLRKFNLFSNSDVELNINLGGIGNIKIKSNYEVAQIAHKAWTELITRKAGLPLEPNNDVIVEVYNSWYQLFGEIRELTKNIPASQIRNNNTQKLVNLLIDSLNKGLRPHLTKWQARFRRWYDNEIQKEENKNKSPQEIQKMYPYYNNLIQDLLGINQQLVSYTNELKKLIFLK